MNFKEAIRKSWKNILGSLPIMFSVLLLVNLLLPLGQEYYLKIFSGNFFFDPLVGALAGSLSFGIPVTSYIIGGELLLAGISLVAITAFVMTWTTVGVVMLPLEAKYLGKKFTIVRNAVNFVFSIIIAVLTVTTLNLFR